MKSRDVLEIFPLKIITSQAIFAFIEYPASEYPSRILFGYLHQRGITITCLVEAPAGGGHRNLVLVVSVESLHKVQGELETLRGAVGAKELAIQESVAVIRILGPHFDIRPAIAGMLYGRLEEAGIKVLANSTTGTTSLLVIQESQLEETLRELKAIFRLPKGK
jgi:aspartate kinase